MTSADRNGDARMKLTAAQRRAIAILPEDGSWTAPTGRLTMALNSLWVFHRSLVDAELGEYGPRGKAVWRWRLTAEGVEVKRTIFE